MHKANSKNRKTIIRQAPPKYYRNREVTNVERELVEYYGEFLKLDNGGIIGIFFPSDISEKEIDDGLKAFSDSTGSNLLGVEIMTKVVLEFLRMGPIPRNVVGLITPSIWGTFGTAYLKNIADPAIFRSNVDMSRYSGYKYNPQNPLLAGAIDYNLEYTRSSSSTHTDLMRFIGKSEFNFDESELSTSLKEFFNKEISLISESDYFASPDGYRDHFGSEYDDRNTDNYDEGSDDYSDDWDDYGDDWDDYDDYDDDWGDWDF